MNCAKTLQNFLTHPSPISIENQPKIFFLQNVNWLVVRHRVEINNGHLFEENIYIFKLSFPLEFCYVRAFNDGGQCSFLFFQLILEHHF